MKKFFKYVLWFFIVIFAAIAVGVFSTWISGAFDPKKIYIESLSINGVKEYVTISPNDESYTTKVDFEPANANQKMLTVKVVTGPDLIDEVPVVTAGENFTIKFAKENGVTKGGELELKFVDSAQNSYAVLKVLIDVRLGTNDLDFKLNGNNVEETDTNALGVSVNAVINEENANTIKISTQNQNALNSYVGNWSSSVNNNNIDYNKLKKAFLVYDNTNTSVTNVSLTPVYTIAEKYYLVKFLSPTTTSLAGEVFEMGLYVYRTFNMESIFSEALAKSVINAIAGEYSGLMYNELNAFINNYVYPNIVGAGKNLLENDLFMDKSTKQITLSIGKLSQNKDLFDDVLELVRDYALVGKNITINVKNIKVEDINVKNQNLKYRVLNSFNFNTNDLKLNLGLSLIGAEGENVDQTILDNNLRQINIYLTKQESAQPEGEGLEFFIINESYYVKQLNNKNAYFEIVKNVKNNGDVEWQLKTLSPIPSSESYALVYEYENELEDWTEVSYGSGSSKKIAYWHYNVKEGKDEFFTTKGDKETIISASTSINNFKNALKTLKSQMFVRAVATLDIDYTQGDIAFKNNNGNATIMLNEQNTLYLNGNAVNNGNGIYYKNRQYLIANDISITPRDAGGVMEYTTVKWFARYSYSGAETDSAKIPVSNKLTENNQYYFLPHVEESEYYSKNTVGGSNVNPEIKEYKLRYIDGTTIENDWTFMELGTGDLNLIALNAMNETVFAKGLELFAVVIQTGINGQPFYPAADTYSVISYATSIVKSDYYVEDLYLYVNNSSSGENWVLANIDNRVVLKEGDVVTGKTVKLSTQHLDVNGEISNQQKTSDVMDANGNFIIISGGINNEHNSKIALFRFYNLFLKNNAYTAENASDADYPDNTYNITIQDATADSQCIDIVISVSNVLELNNQKQWSYIFAIDSRVVSYTGGYYTVVYSNNCYFQLIDSTAGGSET